MDMSLYNHYGKALFEYSLENNIVDKIYKDNKFFNSIIKEHGDFLKLFKLPTVSINKKIDIINRIFDTELDKSFMHFLKIMIRKDAIANYRYINNAFVHYYNDYKGIIEGKLYTPYLLSDDKLNKIENLISKKEKKQVYLIQLIDPKVIGGIKIYLNNKIYDYSIETKIKNVRELLLNK